MKVCTKCGSTNIKHEEKIGRGLPPKNYKNNPTRRISWKGIWDIWTCKDCGNQEKELRK